MTRLITTLLSLLLVLTAVVGETAYASGRKINPLKLTSEEADWLKGRPIVTFTGDPQWLPYEAFEPNGQYIGMVSNFIRELSAATGIQIQYIPSKTWQDALSLVRSGQVDVISSDLSDENIKLTHTFSHPYIENSLVVIANDIGHEIKDLSELKYRRIGLIRDYGYTLDVRSRYPKSNFVDVDNVDDGLTKVANRQIDYFIETYAISQFHLASKEYPSLSIRGRLPITMQLGLAVSNRSPMLLNIINKWIDAMPAERRYQLAEKWYLENTHYFSKDPIDWGYIGLLSTLLLFVSGTTVYIWNSRRELAAKDQRFKQALHAVKAGEWELNLNTQHFYISPLFIDSLPIPVPPSIDHLNDFVELVAPKYQQLLFDNIMSDRLSLNEGIDVQVQLEQDLTCWLLIKGKVIKRMQGLMVVGTMSDISELKHIEQQSAQHEKLIAALFDALPDLVILKNSAGVQTITNRVYSEYFGEKNLDEVVDKDYLPQWKRNEADAVGLKEEQYFSGWLNGKSQPAYFDITLSPFMNENNEAEGILSVARDMTDTYKLTQELTRFRRFAEYSQQGFGIATFDADIKYINPKLAEWLLGSSNALMNAPLSFMQCYPDELQHKIEFEIIPIILKEGAWQGELTLRLADGSTMPTFETFFLVRDESGTPLYIGDVIVDITHQKKIEETLDLARLQAEQANASKSMFLANMSHEIRTPLNAVLGYSQLLMRSDTIDTESKSQVERIYGAGQRLLHLINDILDLSKIEAGKLKLNNSLFNLADEITDVIKLCSVKAHNKQLKLEHEIKLDRHEQTIADKTKIGQVLLNVIDNAIKFTERGSVSVTCWREHNRAYFEVSDTGIGISAEEQEMLFQPFTQGKGGLVNGGTGLGLVLSKRIIETMGGKFELRSKEKVGTTVCFSLDLEVITVDKNSAPVTYRPDAQFILPVDVSYRALIIEDDPLSQDLLNKMLQRMGFITSLCDDGQQGLHYLQTEKAPDIIFTDIRMPNMDGIQLLNLIRTLHVSDSIPIVAVSASSLEHEKRFYLEHGFSDFVAKPVDYGILVTSIARNMNIELNIAQPVVTLAELPIDTPTVDSSATEPGQSIEDLKRAISEAAAFGDIDTVSIKVELLTQFAQWRELREPLQAAITHYDFDRILTLIS
jgi:PAS domain S-box-containing protein